MELNCLNKLLILEGTTDINKEAYLKLCEYSCEILRIIHDINVVPQDKKHKTLIEIVKDLFIYDKIDMCPEIKNVLSIKSLVDITDPHRFGAKVYPGMDGIYTAYKLSLMLYSCDIDYCDYFIIGFQSIVDTFTYNKLENLWNEFKSLYKQNVGNRVEANALSYKKDSYNFYNHPVTPLIVFLTMIMTYLGLYRYQ